MKLLKELPKKFPLNKDIQVLSVFHLLNTSKAFFELLDTTTKLKSVIAIPYSAEKEIIDDYIKSFKNTNFIVPEKVSDIQNVLIEEYKKLDNTKPIVIIEVGGYSAFIIDKLLEINPNLIGIVEDTNQGHWCYQEIEDKLKFPVYSIAQSRIKSLENRLIGKAITFSLENVLRKDFYKTLCGLKIGVLGYGKIGKSSVRNLKNRDAIINVWDIDSVKRLQARLDGYHCPIEKQDVLKNADIILGVSGKHSLRIDDIQYLKEKVILVSGSSKDVEFQYENLCKYADSVSIYESYSVLKFAAKHIIVLNEGQPINFRNNSVLSSILELVFSELYVCLYYTITNPNKIGLHKIDEKEHQALCEEWEKVYLN